MTFGCVFNTFYTKNIFHFFQHTRHRAAIAANDGHVIAA